MAARGARIHLPSLEPVRAQLGADIEAIKAKLAEMSAYRSFCLAADVDHLNINSPKQKVRLVTEFLGVPPEKFSRKTGDASCDKNFLREKVECHPAIPLLMEWMAYQKLKSTYVDALPKQGVPEEDDPNYAVLHPDWRIGGARTWRLSCAEPNLQNIPKRSALGKIIRRAFVPRPGNVFIDVDYSQAEYRVLAALTGEPSMVAAFLEGRDVHAETARRVLGKADITDVERDWGKTLNFSVIYGATEYGLSEKLKIPKAQGVRLLDMFRRQHPKVMAWMALQWKQAAGGGYVESPFGKRRHFGDDEGLSPAERDRQAGNMPIQSAAGEIALNAMVRLMDRGFDIVLQVHDNVLVEVPERSVAAAVPLIKKIMVDRSGMPWMTVPLEVDVKVGPNWGDCAPYPPKEVK